MPRKARPRPEARDIQGLKYLRSVEDLLAPLREVYTHGNREFLLHDGVCLLLLLFFNPVLTSLRSLQQATELEKVQRTLGIKRLSLGAMSRSIAQVFDPELLRPIIEETNRRIASTPRHPRLGATMPEVVKAVDGSVLPCLPGMAWALFRKQSDNRAAKMHVHFDVSRGIPDQIDVTPANESEKKTLRKRLSGSVLYLLDRGYIDYGLFQMINDVGSCFVARLRDDSTCLPTVARVLTTEDRAAKVTSDEEVVVGSKFTKGDLTAPVRRIVVEPAEGGRIVLLTNLMDVPARDIAESYRCRWQVELFFRWFKQILGCTHWVSKSRSGLTLQVYAAILASLLISLWTGRKPTKRTFEMISLYFQGWATAEELALHIEKLKPSS
jgi:hypothetical protein